MDPMFFPNQESSSVVGALGIRIALKTLNGLFDRKRKGRENGSNKEDYFSYIGLLKIFLLNAV